MTSRTVHDLDPFHAEAARRNVPPADVERFLGILRPCASLDPGQNGPVVGRWGGEPMLPAGVPCPAYPFVASIDCAALPPDATDLPLPSDGHLLFFADPEEAMGDCSAGAVVYAPAGTPVAGRGEGHGGGRPLPVQDLRLSIDPSLPNRFDSSPEHPHGRELGSVWWASEHLMTRSGLLQLGGYPWVWNHDPVEAVRDDLRRHGATPEETEADDWILLASADGSYSPDHGEKDIVSWVIPRGDLAARRFDRVHVFTDGL